jgi:hypothetical protein
MEEYGYDSKQLMTAVDEDLICIICNSKLFK